MGAWINTSLGRRFDLFNPDPADILPSDIIHALGNLCRYAGHSALFYSVAEHSCHVARGVRALGATNMAQRYALMHDAAEAYVTDVPTQLKHAPQMSWFRDVEDHISDIINLKFGIEVDNDTKALVKSVDRQMIEIESRAVLPNRHESWVSPEVPHPAVESVIRVECWPPARARQEMLLMFGEVFGL
jgi:hypothetical protein